MMDDVFAVTPRALPQDRATHLRWYSSSWWCSNAEVGGVFPLIGMHPGCTMGDGQELLGHASANSDIASAVPVVRDRDGSRNVNVAPCTVCAAIQHTPLARCMTVAAPQSPPGSMPWAPVIIPRLAADVDTRSAWFFRHPINNMLGTGLASLLQHFNDTVPPPMLPEWSPILAILDTGVQLDHPNIDAARFSRRYAWNFLNSSGDVRPRLGACNKMESAGDCHGTVVVGMALAMPLTSGTAGTSWIGGLWTSLVISGAGHNMQQRNTADG